MNHDEIYPSQQLRQALGEIQNQAMTCHRLGHPQVRHCYPRKRHYSHSPRLHPMRPLCEAPIHAACMPA